MKIKAQILTGWIEDPNVGGFTAEVFIDYDIETAGDLTLQNYVADPNSFVCEIICEESQYDLIDSDPKYMVLASEVFDG